MSLFKGKRCDKCGHLFGFKTHTENARWEGGSKCLLASAGKPDPELSRPATPAERRRARLDLGSVGVKTK